MTASDRVLSRRYARALFQIAGRHRQEEKVAKELADVHKALLSRMDVFGHPMVPASRKKSLLRKILGADASDAITRFLDLLVDKKRLQLLPFAAVEFSRMLDDKHGRMRAVVRSAAEMSSQEKEKLRQKLKNFSRKDVDLDVRVDESLLGGAVIRMGDWVIDGSLKGKLIRLGAQLAEGAR